MFGVTGAAVSKLRHMQNGGKRGRHSVDTWDKQSTSNCVTICAAGLSHVENHGQGQLLTALAVMERDYRLTGYLRGQSDRVKAPKGFEIGSRWKVSATMRASPRRDCILTCE